MKDQEIIDLLKRYKDRTCTASEELIVQSWYNALDYKKSMTSGEYELIKEQIWNRLNPIQKKKNIRYRYAAILMAFLSFSALIYYVSHHHKPTLGEEITQIKPGKNQATLVLGQKDSLDLTELKIGDVVESNGIKIKKLTDGTISYEVKQALLTTSIQNKLIVPRGGQYRIILADSSVIVVNSESELEFPSQFNKTERRIKMVGEGYFEIAKHKNKPFIVQSREQEVTVLGTKFNIEAYPKDKYITTTLLEGKVSVSAKKEQIILKPGEQSVFDGEKIRISNAKIASNTSWKDNLFTFESVPLGNIMQKLARWYHIEVIFENKELAHIQFTGSISKYQDIDQVLHLLEMTDKVKFVIEHQTIYVKTK